MEEHTLLGLIDQYLLGKISPGDKASLEQLMDSDPGIADMVKESRQAFLVLQVERNRLLREKLRELDKEETRPSSILPKWAILLTLIIVTLTGCWFWVSSYFDSASIATRYFESYFNPESGSAGQLETNVTWMKANEAFRKKDFEKAINLYTSYLSEDNNPDTYEAQWNILLSQLALQGPTNAWKIALDSFAKEAPAPIRHRAQKLLALLNSETYHFFITKLQANLSALKPRLI